MEQHDTHGGHSGPYTDITEFGALHGTSSHTHHDSLEGGRTAITTEAMHSYNGLRAFLGLEEAQLEEVGQWAYDNAMTNDATPYGETLKGVGLYYGMQGAKVGWIADDKFDPQLLADIQREARLGTEENVMQMVAEYGHTGYAQYLQDAGLVDTFMSTMQMEPHSGGWMHGVAHGRLPFDNEAGANSAQATSHDLNHLTVLSHDQTQPFMNDTFDYPQWPALDTPEQDVIDYFQAMVTLGDPKGDALPVGTTGTDAPMPVDPMPVDPDPIEPTDPVTPADPDMGGDMGGHDHGGGDQGGTPGQDSFDSGNGSPFDASDYSTVLGKSMQFYYAQYAGDLPEDHPVAWRNDSTLSDGQDVGRDLSGGMFDAGDHVKFGLPAAYTGTTLAWGGIEFKKGYEASGTDDDLGSHLRQLNDYFLQAYDDKGTADISDDVFHAQVGDGHADHAFWGAPENMTMARPTFSVTADAPGSDVAAETAASLAAGSMYFRDRGDVDYADELLGKAKSLFDFAETYQGAYSDTVTNAAPFYNSWSGYNDELSWGANWLYQATGDESYLDKSEDYFQRAADNWAMSWDDKGHGTALLLAHQTGKTEYVDAIDSHLDTQMNDIHTLQGTATNDGLAWVDQWGANRYAANVSFLAQIRAKAEAEAGNAARADELQQFASDQIDYMLGDNPDGFSYVVGFGDDYPLNPHHRAASDTDNVGAAGNNKYVIEGALVGGPSRDGSYEDDRGNYINNEVAIDYNAGFSGALAGAVEALVEAGADPTPDPVDPVPIDPMPVDPTDPTDPDQGGGMDPDMGGGDQGGGMDPDMGGGGHNHGEDPIPDQGETPPLADGGTVYNIDTIKTITDFDPTMDRVDIGTDSIHNQIPVDTDEGLLFYHMFDPNKSLLLEGVNLSDLQAANFAPIADAHLQQDLSAALAWENGTGLVRDNTVYVRSHEKGLEEIVDFDPATDKISFFYLSVRGDQELNFSVEETMDGVRFFSPITDQSITLRDTTLADLNSSHFEYRANQLEDNIAGRMGLADKIENFEIVSENVFSGKSVEMAGLVDRAPYHGEPDYTGTPRGKDDGSPADPDIPVPIDPTPVDPPVDPTPVDPVDPVDPTPDPDPTDPDTGGELDVGLVIVNDWGSGAIVELEITNPGSSTVSGWDITFDFAPGIESVWTGVLSEDPDTGQVTISNKDWNADIAPGETIKVGFQVQEGDLDEAALNAAAKFGFVDSVPPVDAPVPDPTPDPDPMPDPVPDTPGSSAADDNSDVLGARFSVVDDWGSGATLELEISNVDQMDFEGGWDLALNLNNQITNAWNGTLSEGETDNQIVVSSADWIADIMAGNTVKVGIQVDEGNLDEDELNEDADFFFMF